MNQDESMIGSALNLKLQWYGHIYVIIVIHTYLLVELWQLLEQEMMIMEKGVLFKNCALFSKCISSISNIQIDHA